MRPSEEIAQIGLGLCIMAVVMLSLIFPWSFQTRLSRRLAHLPLLLLILYPAYEATMPPGTDIRIDLLLMWPAFGLVGICYAVKLLILSRSDANLGSAGIDAPQIKPGPVAPGERPSLDMERGNERLAHLLPQPKNDNRS
jgi:hypothetical protein